MNFICHTQIPCLGDGLDFIKIYIFNRLEGLRVHGITSYMYLMSVPMILCYACITFQKFNTS